MSSLTTKQLQILKALRSATPWSTAAEVGRMDGVLRGYIHNSPSTWVSGTLKVLASNGYAETMEHLGRVLYRITPAGLEKIKDVDVS